MSIPAAYQSYYPAVDNAAKSGKDEVKVDKQPDFRKDPRGRKSNKNVCLFNLNSMSMLRYLQPKTECFA